MNRRRYRLVIWTIFHPRQSIARYEAALDCLQEAALDCLQEASQGPQSADEPPIKLCGGNSAPAKFRGGLIVEFAPCVRPAGHRGFCHAADPEK
jgi:hypothetical protein